MYHQPTALAGPGGPYLYQWNDDRCNMKHNFICKYEPGDLPCELFEMTVKSYLINLNSLLYNVYVVLNRKLPGKRAERQAWRA